MPPDSVGCVVDQNVEFILIHIVFNAAMPAIKLRVSLPFNRLHKLVSPRKQRDCIDDVILWRQQSLNSQV